MNVKMIVTDLDRTLLRTDKTISAYTAKILDQCRKKGIKVAFATARPKRTVEHFFDTIPADMVILHNGAATFVGDRLFSHCGIAPEVTRDILLSLAQDFPSARLSVEIDDTFYANFDVSTIWNYTEAIHTDFTCLPDKPAEKIIIGVSSMMDIEIYSKYLPDDLYIEMNDGKLGLIMHKDATKFTAVEALARDNGFEISEIVAFGDDYNDLEMIRGCGIGVAMGNALDEVKAAADYVCGTNDNDGVARWIEENVLNSNGRFIIRPVDILDVIDDVGNLIRRSFATVADEFGITKENSPTHTAFISDEKLIGQLSGKENYSFGLFEAGELVGFTALARYGDGYEITRLAVAPDKRHLGYGKRLVNAAIGKAREIGLDEIGIGIVDENNVLKQWYIAQGFTIEKVIKYPHMSFTVCAMGMKL